jgi:hypothetical protein
VYAGRTLAHHRGRRRLSSEEIAAAVLEDPGGRESDVELVAEESFQRGSFHQFLQSRG